MDLILTMNCMQCLALQRNLGGKILFPNSTQFDDQQSGADGYWTQQETNVIPTCRVAATSSQDVATAVSKLADLGCSFAIRSGGMASVSTSINSSTTFH